jgi:hypothetical protein
MADVRDRPRHGPVWRTAVAFRPATAGDAMRAETRPLPLARSRRDLDQASFG